MNYLEKEKRLKVFRRILIFWCLFIGIGAFFGGICMLIKPDGSILQMQELLTYFQVLPFADVLFQDYVFSGIALIIVNGITNIVATILLFKKNLLGYKLGTLFGFTLILWICIQFVIFPMNFMDIIYFIFGLLQFITGVVCLIFYHQTIFKFSEDDYKFIRRDSKTAVVYFSRMGYSKKLAYEYANRLGAQLVELKVFEKTENTSGFWWCGRFGMHRWAMPIKDENLDLSKYDNIIIISSMWVFHMCSPIRFLLQNHRYLKEKNITFVFNHFMNYLPNMAKNEVKNYLPKAKIEDVVCHYGELQYKKEK